MYGKFVGSLKTRKLEVSKRKWCAACVIIKIIRH